MFIMFRTATWPPSSKSEAFCRCQSNSTRSYLCLGKFHLACSIPCLNLLAAGRKMLLIPSHLHLMGGMSHYTALHSQKGKLYSGIMLNRLFRQPGNLPPWQGQVHVSIYSFHTYYIKKQVIECKIKTLNFSFSSHQVFFSLHFSQLS